MRSPQMPAPCVSAIERMLVATCDGDFRDSCSCVAELSPALPIEETGLDHSADSGAFPPMPNRSWIACELHGSKASKNDRRPPVFNCSRATNIEVSGGALPANRTRLRCRVGADRQSSLSAPCIVIGIIRAMDSPDYEPDERGLLRLARLRRIAGQTQCVRHFSNARQGGRGDRRMTGVAGVGCRMHGCCREE